MKQVIKDASAVETLFPIYIGDNQTVRLFSKHVSGHGMYRVVWECDGRVIVHTALEPHYTSVAKSGTWSFLVNGETIVEIYSVGSQTITHFSARVEPDEGVPDAEDHEGAARGQGAPICESCEEHAQNAKTISVLSRQVDELREAIAEVAPLADAADTHQEFLAHVKAIGRSWGVEPTSGSKYHRQIHDLGSNRCVLIDVYSVLIAFAVTDPGLQHAIKKLLCAGFRGKATTAQDLREARDALDRAIVEAERGAT